MFGPAILVTAAFIGPGTVLSASSAGAKYGFTLLWAVAFSVFATIVLQEMAARLGIVTGAGLSQAIRKSFSNRLIRSLMLGLVLAAVLVGNAAYQTGNILGSAAGASAVAGSKEKSFEDDSFNSSVSTVSAEKEHLGFWILLVGFLALVLILSGRFALIQNVLTVLVIAMSVLFLVAAVLSRPSLSEILGGLVPRIPEGSEWFVVGLIGTTVVPYNLFLHASAAAQRWPPESVKRTDDKARAIRDAKRDTVRSILVGGLVTSAILITASTAFHSPALDTATLDSVNDVAVQLEPALGNWARWLFGAGLFAAGLTSAITAPVAAAYAAAGCFGWPEKLSDYRLKIVAAIVVLFGIVFAILLGGSPKETIVLAQVANGLLLPVVAIFLVVILNRVQLMHRFRNKTSTNVLAAIVLVVVGLIAVRQFNSVYLKIQKIMNEKPAVTSVQSVFETDDRMATLLRVEPVKRGNKSNVFSVHVEQDSQSQSSPGAI